MVAEERTPIPGCWACPRCRFQLTKSVLRAEDGAVFVDPDQRREVCPNDGATLEQVYESPDDRLVVMGDCCEDPACNHCYGTWRTSIGWRYRDEHEEAIRPFSDAGERDS